jgi:hypothetical protein
MTNGTVKSVTISLPAEMLEEFDRVRKHEHRSRSELLREAFRCYVAGGPIQRIPIVDPEPGELEALEHGRRRRHAANMYCSKIYSMAWTLTVAHDGEGSETVPE